MSYKVLYLTGAPATGKSTLVMSLLDRQPSIVSFDYGEELKKYLIRKNGGNVSYEELRASSSALVTPKDVKHVDKYLLEFVQEKRKECHVVIDTHAVTKDDMGFRVTPFSAERVKKLNPDIIYVLYASPEVIQNRIKSNDEGRLQISNFESHFHMSLQASVAVNYSVLLGKPVYFFDTNKEVAILRKKINQHLEN